VLTVVYAMNVAKCVDRRDSSDDKGRQRKSVPHRHASHVQDGFCESNRKRVR